MNELVAYVLARLSERSTWVGLVGLVAAAGYILGPEQTEALTIAGMAVANMLAVFISENGSE